MLLRQYFPIQCNRIILCLFHEFLLHPYSQEKAGSDKLEAGMGASGGQLKEDKRSKSYEEREEEYERARARIFNQDVRTE